MFAARPGTVPVPLRTSVEIWAGFSACCFTGFAFCPERRRVRALRLGHVGMEELVHDVVDHRLRRGQLGGGRPVRLQQRRVDRVAEEVPGRQPVGEPRVRLDLAHLRRAAAAAGDLDAALDRADDLRDVGQREVAGQAALQRVEEELLPREAVDVRVGVAEADVVQRLPAVELLVPGVRG